MDFLRGWALSLRNQRCKAGLFQASLAGRALKGLAGRKSWMQVWEVNSAKRSRGHRIAGYSPGVAPGELGLWLAQRLRAVHHPLWKHWSSLRGLAQRHRPVIEPACAFLSDEGVGKPVRRIT